MVTLEGGYDWMECKKCGCFGKRYGVGQFGVTDIQTTRPISNYSQDCTLLHSYVK